MIVKKHNQFFGKIAAMLLIVFFLFQMPVPVARAENAGGWYEYKQPYMRQAVKNSAMVSEGWGALMMDFDSADTIHNLRYLSLANLGLTELPDLSDFISLVNLDLSGNPIQDISGLEGHSTLTGLDISRTQVEALPNIPLLAKLWMDQNPQIKDIGVLENSQTLTVLSLGFGSVEKLPMMPNLTELDITETPVKDIAVLKNCYSLQILRLGNSAVEDYSVFKELSSLSVLDIGNERKPMDADKMEAACALPQLTFLRVFASEIPNLQGLTELKNLSKLVLSGRLSGDKEVAEVFSMLPSLQWIGLIHSGISEISFLAEMPDLTLVLLEDSKVTDLMPLQKLTKLRELNINNNQIKDLTVLAKLKELITVDARNNHIESLKPLSGLKDLQYLDVSGNAITDVSPLKKLKKLNTLRMSSNRVEDISPLKGMNFTTVEFIDNPITDMPKARQTVPNILLGTKEDYDRQNDPFSFADPNVQKAFERELARSHSGVFQPGAATTYKMALACKQLDLQGLHLTKLPDLSAFGNLTILNLLGNQVSDISQVAGMQLEAFECDSTAVTDWSPLYTQRSLKALQLGSGEQGLSLTDEHMDFIAQNTQLIWVDLTANGEVDLAPLAELKELKELHLRTEGPLDFSGLGKMIKLETLALDTKDGEVISGLDGLFSVKTLVNSGDGSIDLSMVAGMKKLETLRIENKSIADFTPLQQMRALKELKLSRTKFPQDSLAQIAGLKKLNFLLVESTQLVDLSPLANMKALTNLALNDCGIEDISVIGKLSKLTALSLNGNKIADITPLAGLRKLEALYLDHNQIISVGPLEKLSKLRALSIFGNQVADLSPIYSLKLTELAVGENPLLESPSQLREKFPDLVWGVSLTGENK